MHIIIEEELYAKEYVESKVERFEEVKELVSKYNPELVSKITTVPVDQIYEAARMYANAERAGIFYTLGITEHTTGTSNVMNLSNLALLCGNIGIEGAGINHFVDKIMFKVLVIWLLYQIISQDTIKY